MNGLSSLQTVDSICDRLCTLLWNRVAAFSGWQQIHYLYSSRTNSEAIENTIGLEFASRWRRTGGHFDRNGSHVIYGIGN